MPKSTTKGSSVDRKHLIEHYWPTVVDTHQALVYEQSLSIHKENLAHLGCTGRLSSHEGQVRGQIESTLSTMLPSWPGMYFWQ